MNDINIETSHKTVKKVSFLLVCIATLLVILDVIDIKMVFGRTEVGLWDNMPSFVRQVMFLGYPICILTSYILFIWTRKLKTRFDTIANILFLLNVLIIIFFVVVYFTKLIKNL
jgi:hypothetical protein